ncbi:MAG TPA: response regulator transcription factor [Acidimicrobiales bacterium]
MAPGLTAVVVDHWPLVRLGMARVIERVGLRVVAECDSGQEAVSHARRAGVALIALGSDLNDDPVATTTALVGLRDRPRVVVLVDHGDRERLAKLLEAGADGVLVRTVGPDELGDAVQRVLAGERVLGTPLLPALVGMTTDALGAAGAGPEPTLTARERAVLRALAGGRTNRDIAAELYMSEATVKTHLSHIYSKLGVTDRQQAVARALGLRLLA